MHVEKRVRNALRIGGCFAHQRQWRIAWRVDFANHAAEIEPQIGLELAGELLHALIVDKAMHLQSLDPAIARAQKRAFKQDGADTMALPGLLDAEGGFALACEE